MSNILIFRPVNGQTRTQPPPDRGDAAILFFTGVRYERQAGEAEQTEARTAVSCRKTLAVGKRIARKKPVAKQAKPAAKAVKTLKPVAKSSRPRKARA